MKAKHLLSALAISVSLMSPFISTAQAADSLDIQQIFQEERAWAGLNSKTIKVGDVEWAYSESPNTNKPTVILIHGLSGSRDNWNRVARYLTPEYHVVIPDLPGHGDTKVPEAFDYSVPNLADVFRRFAEAGNFNKNAHIAGHSLGGSLAALYTGLYFFETQSLLLVDGAGVFKNTNSEFLKNPEKARELLVKKPGDLENTLKFAMNQPPFIPKALFKQQEQLMIKQSTNVGKVVEKVIEQSKLYNPDSFSTLLRAIEAPTLLIWGEKDKIVDIAVIPELVENLKNEEPPVVLPNIGHTPILEAEQLVAQHYLAFLKKTQATPNKFAASAPK